MSDNHDSKPSDLGPYEVKHEITPDMFKKMADALVSVEHVGNGAFFSPAEAISAGLRAGNIMAQMIKIAALALARGIIMPVELLLRFKIGERYFNSTVFLSFLVIYVIAIWPIGVAPAFCNTLLVEVILLTNVHRLICFIRDRKGHYWHSYSEGESWCRIEDLDLFLSKLNFTVDASKIIFEPIILIIIGLALLPVPNDRIYLGPYRFEMSPISLYLFTAALVLFLYQIYCYSVRKNMLLDEKDAAVISEIRSTLMSKDSEPGIFEHKGVTYSVLGGKSTKEPEKDCPNPEI